MNTIKEHIKFSVITRKSSKGRKLYIRITYLNMTTEVCTKVSVRTTPELDNQNFPIDTDKKEQINEMIDELKSYYHGLKRNGLFKRPLDIKQAFTVKNIDAANFLFLFDDFMRTQESEVKGGNLKKGTLKNYYTTQRFLTSFVKQVYGRKDIPLSMFDREFLHKFYKWLVDNTQSTNNGRAKHFERVKRFVTVMTSYDKLNRNPFNGFKITIKVNPRVFLKEEEVCDIRGLKLSKEGLRITRDMFLFMCNTGLACSDLIALKLSQIQKSTKGRVIRGIRKKTSTSFTIPLTDEAERLLATYSNHEIAIKKKQLLPVFSNQTFNDQIKEIVKLAGIEKEVSSHVARHTFATIALTSGVPLVSIQHVLGHSDIRMTQHYSRLVDKKLTDDMEAFKDLMNHQTNTNPYPVILRVV